MSKLYIKNLELQNLELLQKNKLLEKQLDELLQKVKALLDKNHNLKIEYQKTSKEFK